MPVITDKKVVAIECHNNDRDVRVTFVPLGRDFSLDERASLCASMIAASRHDPARWYGLPGSVSSIVLYGRDMLMFEIRLVANSRQPHACQALLDEITRQLHDRGWKPIF